MPPTAMITRGDVKVMTRYAEDMLEDKTSVSDTLTIEPTTSLWNTCWKGSLELGWR